MKYIDRGKVMHFIMSGMMWALEVQVHRGIKALKWPREEMKREEALLMRVAGRERTSKTPSTQWLH